jgi:hypothetical protein
LVAWLVAACGSSGAARDAGLPVDAALTDGPSGQPDAGPFTHGVPPECQAAADRGLAWLVAQQASDGSWGRIGQAGSAMYTVATTAFAVLKLETHAAELHLSPFDVAYQYQGQVTKGLDYLFVQAVVATLSPQVAGNPDADGDGKGVTFQSPASVEMYETAIALMAIVAGRSPTRVVETAGSQVSGWTYQRVAQGVVDYIAFAQSDDVGAAGVICQRGGWRYEALDHAADGDNSVSQFITLALEYAVHPQYGFGSTVPDFVRLELGHWLDCVQIVDGGGNQGGSGYLSKSDAPNVYKTGALIQEAAFLGDYYLSPRIQNALGFLARHWDDPPGVDDQTQVGWKGAPANYLAMYSIMKGLASIGADDVQGIDWYRDFCDVLIAQQDPAGFWPRSQYDKVFRPDPVAPGSGLLATEWALLTLERAAPPPVD